ncbi:MAG: ATP-binding protein [Syntrophobacteraceae bacterium]
MAIKSEADRIHFQSRPTERALANNLDEAFDISHANRFGDKSYWIADPKPHVRERFGLQNEILAIYSPDHITDARVLTAIEQISRHPDFKHRIDKVLYLLVHNGDIEDTHDLLKTDPDRVIVPFQPDELLNPQKGSFFIRQKIAAHLGEIDLFGMSSPITYDKYFFGRDDLVQELMVRATVRKENSGVFGLRKTGKTSVFKALQRRTIDRQILTEYVDCSNPGMHAARWWEVLESLVARMSENIRCTFSRNCELLLDYTPTNAGIRFSTDIRSIMKIAGLDKIILMMDEVEFITPGISGALGQHWDDDFVPFWQSIRAAHQELDGALVFIVAGVNPASVEETRIKGIPNPIFQLALPYYLEPFKTPSVREMVRTIGRYSGLKFDENIYDYLNTTYGGHPFLIRIACSEVWRSKNKADPNQLINVSKDDFRINQPGIRARLSQPIKDILLSLVWWYPEEYDLLQILAHGDDSFFKEYLASKPGSVVQFAKYGILKNVNSGEFAISDLREFLVQNGEDYKKAISPFLRGDIPPEYLPQVPNLENLGILFSKKCELEIKLRKVILLYFGIRFNWNNAYIANAMSKGLKNRSGGRPEDFFLGRVPQEAINELYTLELKSIIASNWDVFGQLFDKNKVRFEMNMDTINVARRADSHTKVVTASQLEDFNNSYNWLLNRINKVPSYE